MPRELFDPLDVRALLEVSRVVAVLGAHPDAERPAHYVPAYLHTMGYRIVPVNPRFVGTTMFGAPVRATLAELAEPIDFVDVFRPGPAVAEHLKDMLAMVPPPRAIWLQLGIENHEVCKAVVAAGIDFVQDRCTLADHRRFGLPRISPPVARS